MPKGACTVTDEPALTVTANRFVPDRVSCPDVVDTFSTWIAYDPKTLPPSNGPFNAKVGGRLEVMAGRRRLCRAHQLAVPDPCGPPT